MAPDGGQPLSITPVLLKSLGQRWGSSGEVAGALGGDVGPASGVDQLCANRKALTTWQDAAAPKQLKHLANDLGTSQQALIAEGINHVLAKYGKPTVAT